MFENSVMLNSVMLENLENLKGSSLKLAESCKLLKSAGMMEAKNKAVDFAEASKDTVEALGIVVLDLAGKIERQRERIAELENRMGIRHHG